ncbi:hypothetical protein [Wolbachia pipientis]|nr:hypothetical protein [Wolbachia pipientis]
MTVRGGMTISSSSRYLLAGSMYDVGLLSFRYVLVAEIPRQYDG